MGGAGESRALVPFAIAGIHPAIGAVLPPESVGTLYPDLLSTRLPRVLEKLSRSRENVTSAREEEGWR